MTAIHGSPSRGIKVPQGVSVAVGGFGRMFPNLPARAPTGLELAGKFGLPGGKMDGGDTTDEQENPTLHAGFTYLGQFMDHDLTFDATSRLDRQADVGQLPDFRSPRLDMDNLYAFGPIVSQHIYDPDSFQTKLTHSSDGVDLARTADGLPLIGDPRNDENMLLAQLHLAFIKFHNRIVDELRSGTITDALGRYLPPKPPDEPDNQQPGATLDQLLDVENYYNNVFARAQQLVRWHYQWIIVHEFLPAFVDADVLRDVDKNGTRFFRPIPKPFIPVEFAVAAFRMGHPTIRSSYRVNDDFVGEIFPDDPEAPTTPRTDLRGGPVDADHAVDWSNFFCTEPGKKPAFARKIMASLNEQLLNLPVKAVPGAKEGAVAQPAGSLVIRNLLRSETQGLPSGQDVARKIGEVPLSDDELDTTGPIYLWYYVLKEAEVRAGGLHLGPVGSRIVAETLIGLLDANPTSYRATYPQWQPTLANRHGDFGIVDLLRFAGVAPDPREDDDWYEDDD